MALCNEKPVAIAPSGVSMKAGINPSPLTRSLAPLMLVTIKKRQQNQKDVNNGNEIRNCEA